MEHIPQSIELERLYRQCHHHKYSIWHNKLYLTGPAENFRFKLTRVMSFPYEKGGPWMIAFYYTNEKGENGVTFSMTRFLASHTFIRRFATWHTRMFGRREIILRFGTSHKKTSCFLSVNLHQPSRSLQSAVLPSSWQKGCLKNWWKMSFVISLLIRGLA